MSEKPVMLSSSFEALLTNEFRAHGRWFERCLRTNNARTLNSTPANTNVCPNRELRKRLVRIHRACATMCADRANLRRFGTG